MPEPHPPVRAGDVIPDFENTFAACVFGRYVRRRQRRSKLRLKPSLSKFRSTGAGRSPGLRFIVPGPSSPARVGRVLTVYSGGTAPVKAGKPPGLPYSPRLRGTCPTGKILAQEGKGVNNRLFWAVPAAVSPRRARPRVAGRSPAGLRSCKKGYDPAEAANDHSAGAAVGSMAGSTAISTIQGSSSRRALASASSSSCGRSTL